jgi:hypothetical protein
MLVALSVQDMCLRKKLTSIKIPQTTFTFKGTMGVKPEARTAFFDARPEQFDLASRLDEAFDVSFGAAHGELAFWLAQPKKGTRERFGLQKEVLVLYSPHQRTDARVLTAIENLTRSPDFKHRVDKVLFFLVHRGERDSTADLVRSDKERIIIPVHAEDLLDTRRGPMFLRAKMTNELGAVDLFGMSSPLTSDKYFFGRDEIVQSLVRRATIQKSNAGLFGLRKTGKTSVLFAIERSLNERPLLVDYIDCQNPGIHSARWWEVLSNIIERCRATLKANHRRDARILGDYSRKNAGTRFVLDLETILRDGQVEQILFLFDEIEFITAGVAGALGQHWDDDFVPFWQTIRAAHQELQGKVTFIVAGVNPATVDKSHFGGVSNPIFQLATPTYLEPLKEEAIRTMVRSIGRYAGLSFEENVYSYLCNTYGGHPYLVRIACSEVWKNNIPDSPLTTTTISVADFQKLRPEIRSRLARPIKDILLSLVWWYSDEYSLLQILASGEEEFVRDYMEQSPEALTQFAHYGLLIAGSTEFAIQDVAEFLREFGEEYKREISPFARSDMPMGLLPEVPDLDVLSRMFEKRVRVEIALRKAIIIYIGMKCTWDVECMSKLIVSGLRTRPDRPDPQSLFVGRTPQVAINDLYLLDLKEIIVAQWVVFNPLFSNQKSRFEMNMDTVNIARRVDSHTKPVSRQELIDFENSYGWLLSRLEVLSNFGN